VTREEQDCKKVGFSKTVKGAPQAATLPTSLVGSGLNASSSLCLPRHRSLRVASYRSQDLPVQSRFNSLLKKWEGPSQIATVNNEGNTTTHGAGRRAIRSSRGRARRRTWGWTRWAVKPTEDIYAKESGIHR
jgi:hypothetical protein